MPSQEHPLPVPAGVLAEISPVALVRSPDAALLRGAEGSGEQPQARLIKTLILRELFSLNNSAIFVLEARVANDNEEQKEWVASTSTDWGDGLGGAV